MVVMWFSKEVTVQMCINVLFCTHVWRHTLHISLRVVALVSKHIYTTKRHSAEPPDAENTETTLEVKYII